MKLELDPRDPSKWKYDKLRKHVLNDSANADDVVLLDPEDAPQPPGVHPYSIPAGVPVPPMPVVVNIPLIPNEETLAPAQDTEEIPIGKAKNSFNTKMNNMMKPFEAWAVQPSKATDPSYAGYLTARVYAI
jgi:hypothetical protein